MYPFYLSVSPFYFQDFGSSLLLWIVFQVGFSFPLLLFGLRGFYHCYFICCMLLCLLILFDLLYLGYPFCRMQSCSSSYCVESALSGWGWVSILCRFPDWGDCCLCSGGWSLILSPWRAVPHLQVCFGVFVNLVWIWVACLLMGRIVFLVYWWFGMRNLALEIGSLWVGSGLSAELEAFGRAFTD